MCQSAGAVPPYAVICHRPTCPRFPLRKTATQLLVGMFADSKVGNCRLLTPHVKKSVYCFEAGPLPVPEWSNMVEKDDSLCTVFSGTVGSISLPEYEYAGDLENSPPLIGSCERVQAANHHPGYPCYWLVQVQTLRI